METALFIIFSVFCAIGFLYVIMLISEWFVFGDRETVVRAKVEVHVQGGGMFCAGLARGLIEFMSRIRTGQGRPEIVIVDDGLTDRNRQELEYIPPTTNKFFFDNRSTNRTWLFFLRMNK